MYKYKSGQISITDFGQPMGMHLNEKTLGKKGSNDSVG